MSDLYPYFSPLDNPKWEGEVPSPADVGDTDVGQSSSKSNADHQHGFFFGPWNPLSLANPWLIFGTPYRSPEYARVGGTCMIHGMIKGGNVGQTIAILPTGFAPHSGTEILICWGAGGAVRVDIRTDGTVILSEGNAAIGAGPYGYISLGPHIFTTD
jgi:hypothetical protein